MNTQRGVLVEAFDDWRRLKVPHQAAAVSFYALFSAAPLLVLVLSTASLVLGHKLAHGAFVLQMREYLGPAGTQFFLTVLHPVHRHHGATLIGLIAWGWGTTAAFAEMQGSLNVLWGVRLKQGGYLRGVLRSRFFSFGLVFSTGFLLIASLIATALVSALGHGVTGFLPQAKWLFSTATFAIAFTVETFLFASVYKILPDVVLAWDDVWPGALFTSVLFTAGKYFLGMYLHGASITTAYGAAGSLVLLLLWVFYSSQILFFGVIVTRIRFARRNRIVPKPHAEMIDPSENNR
jgi:membrane protein